MIDTSQRRTARLLEAAELAFIAVVSYLPFLISSPGVVSSDSKQALYVDPGSFMADSVYLWNPRLGAGGVPHQSLGYLWPMGPWFWFFDQIGTPTWLAQRLWWGSLSFVAYLGARWLLRSLGLHRSSALAGAAIYALSPYQFAFTARASVLLLPWVGLPLLVELTRRSIRHGGWRHPALFALVIFTIAGVNAATLLLVGIAPLIVVITALIQHRSRWRDPAFAALRIGTLTLPVCAWWAAGLRVQGAYGLPVLQLTENLETVATRSSPDDVIRGLGNWFFYGADRAGWSIDQAGTYSSAKFTAVSMLLPALGLCLAIVLRWRHKQLFVTMLLAGLVIAVGAWPFADPSPLGRVYRAFSEGTSVGLALRNSPRIVPVLVLALAALTAGGISTITAQRRRLVGAVLTIGVAALAVAPSLLGGMVTSRVARPEDLPQAWIDAANHLDAKGSDTRVLELPGANFSAYRWGNTIEPITPLLTNRSYLSREVLPTGTESSALLVDALDRRLQNETLDPRSVAPIARLLGVGDVVIRSDLEWERFGLISPDEVWNLLVNPRAPGLAKGSSFGEPVLNSANPALAPLLPRDLLPTRSKSRDDALSPVTVMSVTDSSSAHRTWTVGNSIVLAGDAEGIVDAAAAGIVDGTQAVLLSNSLDETELADQLKHNPRLVVTDTNRRRAQSWFSSIVDTRGATEKSGEIITDPLDTDHRLEMDARGDKARSVIVTHGADARATSSGGTTRPEDRPRAAIDGRLSTAWRIGGAHPEGERIWVTLDKKTAIDHVVLTQPQDGPRDRVLTKVKLTLDGGQSRVVSLDETSLSPEGQTISFPSQSVERLDIELLETTDPGFDRSRANAVGFGEIQVGNVRASESVRMPIDLLDRAGESSSELALDLVMNRSRLSPNKWDRHDEEPVLDRIFTLPTTRTFSIAGTARVATTASDDLVDQIFGTSSPVNITSSSRLQGSQGARSSRAFDRDRATAWTSAFGSDLPQSILVKSPEPLDLDVVSVDVVIDQLHSAPTHISVIADGEMVGSKNLDLASNPDQALQRIDIDLSRTVRASNVRLVVDAIDARPSVSTDPNSSPLPISIAEIHMGDLPAVPTEARPTTACVDDLLEIDGRPISVRLGEELADGSFSLEGCGSTTLNAGEHRLVGTDGSGTGLNVDSLHLFSDASGPDVEDVAPPLTVTRSERTRLSAVVESDGSPFWYTNGQSFNPGWKIKVSGAEVGPQTMLNGYSTGWLITPSGAANIEIDTSWTPQRS
ncbi:MAG: DUF3367 domain-containing protein, partial [Acidimicrobiales bacterium]|nr:DUF3367 domain-containing protein [Acidimicrobiales bacterium]